MQRKLFASIEIPESDRIAIRRKIEKWHNLPFVWTRPENFHLTVAFLGYVDDENLPEYCDAIARVCAPVDPFEVLLDRITLAPHDDDPRILWLRGEGNKQFDALREKVEKVTGAFSRDRKSSVPHITLGRVRAAKWKKLDETPNINEPVRIPVYAGSLTLFESTTDNGKRVYVPLQECGIGSDEINTEKDDEYIRGDNR